MAIAIPRRVNLSGYCLGRAARTRPDKIALKVVRDVSKDPETWTYAALDLAVRRVAAGLLAEGLRTGDRVLLRLPGNSDYVLMFFGAIAAGLVPIPVSSQLTDGEVAVLLEDSAAAAVAISDDLEIAAGRARVLGPADLARLKSAAPLREYADTAANDPAYMIYTSGTSGRPKGVMHGHRVVVGREPMRRDWQAIGEGDVMLHAGAFNWSYTLGVGLLDPWCVGGTAVLCVGPRDVSIWPALIRSTGATLFAAVPSLYRQILKYGTIDRADFGTIRHCLAAGESLSRAIHDAWVDATGCELYEALGMSECSTFVSSGPGVPIRPGSAGKPQQGRRIAILPIEGEATLLPPGDVGLLAIHRSDPGLMLGYWQRPDEDALTTRGDWFIGGDLAMLDADGYLFHSGRADDTMNAGGYRVSPVEVEAALADCAGLAEVGVAERRIRPDVSIIAAYVVRSAGSSIGETDVLNHAAMRLAAYKRPKHVIFLDALPRSANGKLLRRQLA